MGWEIKQGGVDCPFEVVNQDTGERVACHMTEADAQDHIQEMVAGEADMMMKRAHIRDVVEVDERTASVDNVNEEQRIITVIACPYEQATEVLYHNEPWREVVSRSAFAGIQRKNKIRVNREHDRALTVGKVVGYYPERPEGLVIDTYIAQTPLGDETLKLARDGILDGSVGMRVAASDQVLDRRNRTRRINRAYLDHFAFTADPAYEGAQVLSVRANPTGLVAPRPATPELDRFWDDPILCWADERLK